MLASLGFQQEVASLVAGEADDRGVVDLAGHGTHRLLLGVAGRVPLSGSLWCEVLFFVILAVCLCHYGNHMALVNGGAK